MSANGLTPEQETEVERIGSDIEDVIESIRNLPRHRSLALAITQLE